MKTVLLKLSKMRKADECVVYPGSENERNLLFQGDRLVGAVDPITGQARINYRHGSTCPGFLHLQDGMKGLELIKLAQETIDLIKSAQPKRGDRIGGCVFIG
jgi:hypothetical protein